MIAPSLTADSITATNVVVGTQIVQIGAASPTRLPFDLPPLDGPLVGRDDQRRAVAAQVHAGKRTVSITGLAGVGKRTFAIALAQALSGDFPDGQIVADLAGFSASHPPRAAVDVLRELFSRFHPYGSKPPQSEEALRGEYLSALHDRRAIVLLTNVRDAAQVAQLLPPASCLALVTSQSELRLGIPIEMLPLAQADAAALLQSGLEGQLEDDQAQRLAQLCGQLPAALLFARGYLLDHDLTPAETYLKQLQAKSLADALSVSALLQVSFDGLHEMARAALARLSIMPAGFDRAAACAVVGCGEEAGTAVLQALKRINLVDFDRASRQFAIHVLVRDFARSRLPAGELAATEERYIRHFQGVAEEADAGYLRGGDAMLAGLALFDRERAHVTRALELATRHWSAARTPAAARQLNAMSDAVTYIAEVRLAAGDRQQWLAAQLDALRNGGVNAAEGMTCQRLANTWLELDRTKAAAHYEEALQAATANNDERLAAMALLGQATIAVLDGRITDAEDRLTQASTRAQQAGDLRVQGWALFLRASVAAIRDDRALVPGLLDEAADCARETGDLWLVSAIATNRVASGTTPPAPDAVEQAGRVGDARLTSLALGTIGFSKIAADPRVAADDFRRLLEGARKNGDRRIEATALAGLSSAAMLLGESAEALDYAQQAIALVQAIGDKPSQFLILLLLGLSSNELEDWERAIGYFSSALALTPEIGGRRGAAQAHQGIADARAQQHQAAAARRHYEAALVDARASADAQTRLNVGFSYAGWLRENGDTDLALELYRESADLAHEAGEVNREGFFRTQSGMIHQERGDARAAAVAFAAAADAMEGTPASLQHRGALTGAMLACVKLAEPANVIRYGERALALAHDDADAATGLHNVVGIAYAALGNGTRAVQHFECGATLARAAGNAALETHFTAQIAQVSAPSS